MTSGLHHKINFVSEKINSKNLHMRFENPVPVTTIASMIGASIEGNTEGMATGINEIHRVER